MKNFFIYFFLAITPFFYSFSKTEVWVYTSLYKDVLEEMNPLLKKALPNIDVKWFQGGSETIASKVNAEIAAGGSQAHLILTSDPFWYYELKVNGHLAPYSGPHFNIPVSPEFSDPENYYRAIRLPVMVLGYNSTILEESTLPQKWEEIADPKWKSLIAMPSPLESGTSFTTVALLSQKLGWDFFYGLQKNNILAAGGNSSVLNRIETGERPLGILLLENILKAQKKGSPVRPHYVSDGVIPMSSPIALMNNPKNMDAAKKVYDWFYTDEAQLPIIKSGMFSLIPNAPTPEFSKSYLELKNSMIPWNPNLLESLYKNRHEIKNKFTQIIFHQKTKEELEHSSSKNHTRDLIIEATLRSLALSFCVALLAGFIGFTLAWLVTRTYFPGRTYLSGLLTVPYILPAYLLGMAWIVLANPTVGLFRNFIPGSQGSYGFWAMVFVETCVAFTFPFLELKASFNRMNPSLEEAARMSGANPFQTLRDIGLPLLWPSLMNGMCLAFLYTLSSFGVPALLGLPVREFVLTTLIYSQFKLGGSEGLTMGLWLSLLLLSIVCCVLLISYFLTRSQRKKNLTIVGAKTARPSIAYLGKLTWPIFIVSWGFLFFAVLIPWAGLGLSALAPVAGHYSPMEWTLKNIWTVLSLTEFKQALFNSLRLAFIVSIIIIFMGFILSYFAARKKSRVAKTIIELLGIPFATPGIVLGIFIVFISTWSASIFKIESLLFWMGLAYGLKYSAIGAKMQLTAFLQVDTVLEEAARMSGARTFYILKDIWAPLLKKTLYAVFLLSLLPMLTELAMSTLLTGPGAATLGTVLFQLQEYSDQSSAAALAWLLLTMALFLSLITSLTLNKEES